MKKTYEKPLAKRVTFDYMQAVVASERCNWTRGYTAADPYTCEDEALPPFGSRSFECGWNTEAPY